METLVYILLAINVADLLISPGYIVWIIRRGNHNYDFQQIHRFFNLVQLFLFVAFISKISHMTVAQIAVASLFMSSILMHNNTDSYKYILRLRKNLQVIKFIINDLIKYRSFIMEDDYDVSNRAWGRRCGFLDYVRMFWPRFFCDILAIAVFVVFFL